MNGKIQRIYALRKEGNIEKAYSLCLSLRKEEFDDDAKKAMSWVLIDLCKKSIGADDTNSAEAYFSKLTGIQIDFKDSFAQLIDKQILFLRPKIDVQYTQIKWAEEASKNGNEQQALNKMHELAKKNQLSELHHETYGWIIYRYIKAVGETASSIEIRTELRNYMLLKNERPSLLHSMILNFALNYSKHSDFNFYNFFLLWNPANLRYEDLNDSTKDEKTIPSLLSRICRVFVDANTVFDIEKEIIQKVELNKEEVLDLFRGPFYWLLYNAHKENRYTDLWRLFNEYNHNYARYGESEWHSNILKLAERNMTESDSYRFVPFFKEWNPANLASSDWREERGKNGESYKPLAIKAIKKSFEVIKNQQNNQDSDSSWLLALYAQAVKLFPNDEWLIRDKALLHIMQREFTAATEIYKVLALELADKYYVWQEFAECIVSENSLKIGMLCKALRLGGSEDFLGDIHLKLAQLLIEEKMLENALVELTIYKKHREKKEWKLSSLFDTLFSKVKLIQTSLVHNNSLYAKYVPLAEDFAYQDIEWQEFVLVDRWKIDDRKEKLLFLNSDSSIELAINANRFPVLKRAKNGEIFRFKLHKQSIKEDDGNRYNLKTRYIPLQVEITTKERWTIFNEEVAFVTYINKEKKIVHAVTTTSKEVYFPQLSKELQLGDFIKANSYTKKVKEERRTEFCNIRLANKNEVLTLFPSAIAVVDSVNELKQLFHYVINRNIHGIVRFSETKLRPLEGQLIKVMYISTVDKSRNVRTRILSMEKTSEVNPNLKKDVEGLLELKYKGNNNPNRDWEDDFDNCEDSEVLNPDFGFVGNYYVPKYLLEKYSIQSNCQVKATVVNAGDKWKVFEIQRL